MTENLSSSVSAVCRPVTICWTVVINVTTSPSAYLSAVFSAVFWRWVSAGGVFSAWFATARAYDFPGETVLEVKWRPEDAWRQVLCSCVRWSSFLAPTTPSVVAEMLRLFQYFGTLALSSLSGPFLWRWPSPHHTHLGGCLQLIQIWSNRWQLYHCVKIWCDF